MKAAIRSLLSSAALCAGISVAQQTDAPRAIDLFDGRSLVGWAGDPDVWSVRDGRIVGSTVGRPIASNTFLVWQGGEVEDFVLTCRIRVEGDNNSGVQYRSRVVDAATHRVAGYQCDIHGNPDYTGMLYSEGDGRGIVARRGERVVVDADTKKPRVVERLDGLPPIDVARFHDYRITARGERLVHEVDGVVTVEVTDWHPARASRGVIALQVHAGAPMTVTVESVRLERLPSAGAEAAATPSGDTAGARAARGAPHWIWAPGGDRAEVVLRGAFEVAGEVRRARLIATCDNRMRVLLNGVEVLRGDDWYSPQRAEVGARLVAGANALLVFGGNDGGPAGFVARLLIEYRDGRVQRVDSDASWRAHERGAVPGDAAGEPGFDDAAWPSAQSFGPAGAEGLPWTPNLGAGSFDAAEPATPLPAQPVREAREITVLPGFVAELVFDLPREAGSLVSLAVDPRGRLWASDQKRGLFRVTPARVGDGDGVTTVERCDVALGGAQGLLWAFDSLYAVVNGRDSGLYRLRDGDGDDELDTVDELVALRGDGEHGPHAVALAPDGESLLVMCGNHTHVPAFTSSRVPPNWGEDLLLPRLWDANGHARGRMAPGGFLSRVSPDGVQWEIVSVGYRNAYDVAVAPDGELFTFDSDMEWDMGMPWYRPTRICHAVSGSEFGWRSGSGKWPTWYPDSLPALLDIGPGSPTGVLFGTGAAFPEKYARALFALDWTFGTLWAVHLEEHGATFHATAEEFASGRPLALCDAVVCDGALYFVVGGRGTKSALYRIRWAGDADAVVPVAARDAGAVRGARAVRFELEAFHGRVDAGALDAAWPRLGDADRFVRFAARVAIEAQPVGAWRARALAEREPPAALEALLALARHGEPADLVPLLRGLDRLDARALSAEQRLGALRVVGLALLRLGPADDEVRRELVARLDPYLPSGDTAVDAELVALLAHLGAPSVVDKALAAIEAPAPREVPQWSALLARNDTYGTPIRRMLEDMPPAASIGHAFALRTVRYGWTLAQRRAYFEFLDRALRHQGGHSYAGFLRAIRADAIANCSTAELAALGDLTGAAPAEQVRITSTPPVGPGRAWTTAAALEVVGEGLSGRSFERGRNLFHATTCSHCHRFDGAGGDLAPDLTTVANKFGLADLLEAIVEPSKVISDQYAASVVQRKNGRPAIGRVVDPEPEAGGKGRFLEVHSLSPDGVNVRMLRDDVLSITPSAVSPMPAALLDRLNPDELRDLVAYLLSRGDPEDAVFR